MFGDNPSPFPTSVNDRVRKNENRNNNFPKIGSGTTRASENRILFRSSEVFCSAVRSVSGVGWWWGGGIHFAVPSKNALFRFVANVMLDT